METGFLLFGKDRSEQRVGDYAHCRDRTGISQTIQGAIGFLQGALGFRIETVVIDEFTERAFTLRKFVGYAAEIRRGGF